MGLIYLAYVRQLALYLFRSFRVWFLVKSTGHLVNSFLSSGRSNQLISVCFLISGTVFLTNFLNHFGCKLKTVLHDTNKNCQTNDLGRVFENNKEGDIHFALRIVQVQKLIKICRELTEIF